MLNTNQSNRKNAFKFAIVIPVLVVFIILFQVKVIAKERVSYLNTGISTLQSDKYVIEKSSTDKELKEYSETFKKEYKIDLNFKGVKRNSDKEITAINISLDDNKGKKANQKIESEVAIKPIYINVSKGKDNSYSFAFGRNAGIDDEPEVVIVRNKEIGENDDVSELEDMDISIELSDIEVPEVPMMKFDMPTPPSPPNVPNVPSPPKNPNDKKAWAKFEKEMEAFDKKMKGKDWEKFEADMKVFEEKMKAVEPKMKKFEEEMRIYESKVDKNSKVKTAIKEIELDNGDVAVIFQNDKLKVPGKPTVMMSDNENVEFYINNVKKNNDEIEKIDPNSIKNINVYKNTNGKTQVYVIAK